MNTEPVRRVAYSPPAERMRLYRKRRWEGMQLVRIPLHVTEIDDLISMGRLDEDQRHDAEALQTAVVSAHWPHETIITAALVGR
jgi:hypothetical protein